LARKWFICALLDNLEEGVEIELFLAGQFHREYLLSFIGRQYLFDLWSGLRCLVRLSSWTRLCAGERNSTGQRSCHGNVGSTKHCRVMRNFQELLSANLAGGRMSLLRNLEGN